MKNSIGERSANLCEEQDSKYLGLMGHMVSFFFFFQVGNFFFNIFIRV